MEIPQRLMMQSFVWYLLKLSNVEDAMYISIIITAIVWCCSIFIQMRLSKNKLNKKIVIELLSSFVFSMGIGYLFAYSGFIVLSMVAHFIERILSAIIRNKFLIQKEANNTL